MKLVAVITESTGVDAILRSMSRSACRDPFVERPPRGTAAPGTPMIQ